MSELNIIQEKEEKSQDPDHISYSGLSTWNECPHRYKLTRVVKLKEPSNIFFAFGKAVHDVCELRLLKEAVGEFCDDEYLKDRLTLMFDGELKEVPEDSYDEKTKEEFLASGLEIVTVAFPALKKKFGNFKVVATEEELSEELEGFKQKFTGFIDLVLQTEDGKYHIIDWKTTSWGWKAEKKSSAIVTYQLTLYKNFWAKKNGVDPKDVETHFALLKRTISSKAKPEDRVEIFRVTSGPKKTNNALNLLEQSLYNIKKRFYPKNRTSCTYCAFRFTDHCKR